MCKSEYIKEETYAEKYKRYLNLLAHNEKRALEKAGMTIGEAVVKYMKEVCEKKREKK